MHQSTGKKNKITLYLIFLFILSTTSGKFLDKQKNFSLKINKVEVIGLTNSQNLEIKNELSNLLYQNLFILGKKEVNKIIKKYNIIDEFNVKKIYPSTLSIVIKPTKFVAKLTVGDQLIVGANGKLISNEKNNKILPYIFGEFNSKKFLDFKKKIDLSNFDFNNLKTIYFFPSNRWDVLTGDNILIKLPQKNVLENLNLVYKILSSTQLNDKNIIDLRINNHLIVN